jgi:hypothetical protein
VTDPRQLYQKFNNLMQQNKIEIQYNKAMVNMAQGKEQEP